MKSFLITLSLVIPLVFSCGDGGQKKLKDEGVTPKPEKKEALAVVGEVAITPSDLDAILQSTHPILKPRYESAEGREELLNKMIARALLYMEGVKTGVLLEEKVAKSIEDYKVDLVSDIVKNRFLEKEISDKGIEGYYKKNKEKYSSKGDLGLDSVKRDVKADLSRELLEKHIEGLRKEFPVSINRESLNK